MKVRLEDAAGNPLRTISLEGVDSPPQVLVSESNPADIFLLTLRDDPNGFQVYTKQRSVAVLP